MSLKLKIDFNLPKLSATKIVTWNCHADDSAKRRDDMILGRDILTALGLKLNVSDHVVESDYRPFKEFTETMVNMGTYEFKYLETWKIRYQELSMNTYTKELHESEQVCNPDKQLCAF